MSSNKKWFVLFVVGFSAVGHYAVADSAPSQVSPAVTKQDIQDIRQKLGVLLTLADKAPTTSESPTITTTTSAAAPVVVTHKSWEDVLDLTSGFVVHTAQTLETAAPKVWSIMVIQQYAKAVTNLIFPLTWVILFSVILLFRTKYWKRPETCYYANGDWTDDYMAWFWIGNLFPGMILSIAFLCFGRDLAESIAFIINPKYYAVRDVFLMIMSPDKIK